MFVISDDGFLSGSVEACIDIECWLMFIDMWSETLVYNKLCIRNIDS